MKKLTKKREGKNIYYMSSANNGDPTENIMLEPQIEFMANLANWATDTLNFNRTSALGRKWTLFYQSMHDVSIGSFCLLGTIEHGKRLNKCNGSP